MKRVVVLGTSIAAVKAVEIIRQKDQEADITIISLDGFYPCNRLLFGPLIAKEHKTSQLYYKSREFFEKNKINVLLDKKIDRVNLNRKKIFTEEKEQIDFDILIIADFPTEKYPDVKGTSKAGVNAFNKLKIINELYDTLPIYESVAIQSDRLKGLEVALAFRKQEKDVTLVTQSPQVLSSIFPADVCAKLAHILIEKGLNLYTGTEISEILGEGEAKAVRLKSNKVVGGDVILFVDAAADHKLFADSHLAVKNRIVVDGNFKTNVDSVYAVDLAAQQENEANNRPDKSVEELEQQGTLVAAHILGENTSAISHLAVDQLRSDGLDIIGIGSYEGQGQDVKIFFDEANFTFKKLVINEGRAVGAVLVNARDKKDLFRKAVEGSISLVEIAPEFIAASPAETQPQGNGALLRQLEEGQ
ncbi:MAG TPA: FAD-dependent oxidoreductase [Candidatus Omnitrophota bacterium]|nr:FAD-dependent oxidoreductase [Candidatus Omnitrophota bacterium]